MSNTFSAYDIRGHVDGSLTTEHVWNVGKAVAEWLPGEGPIAIATREDTDPQTLHAFVEGVLLQGRDVLETGEDNQQGLIALLRDGQADGGALITHDALQGIEIITLLDARGTGVTAESGLTEIGELVDAGNFMPAAKKGEIKTAV
jgi:hypothetical protein